MLLLSILSFLFSHGIINAHPLALAPNVVEAASAAASPPACTCPDTGNQRSIWNIIWSCLVTIFACTWIAVHSNIPPESATMLQVLGRRLKTMFWMIIAPEVVMVWAMRQWVGACAIEKQFESRGWTKTHGFFIQMGGFTLYDGDKMLGTLSVERLESLLEDDLIDFPTIRECDIEDKSKADIFSKGLVLVQTLWFLTQCFARFALHLAVTELEVATMAFAALNGIMYFFWWNKPLDVGRSVPVYLKARSVPQLPDLEFTPLVLDTEKIDTEAVPEVTTLSREADPELTSDLNTPELVPMLALLPGPGEQAEAEGGSTMTGVAENPNTGDDPWGRLFSSNERDPVSLARIDPLSQGEEEFLWKYIKAMHVTTVAGMTGIPASGSTTVTDGAPAVHPFYAQTVEGTRDNPVAESLAGGGAVVTMLFGAIHCIAWNFHFPTPIEQKLWHIAALLVIFFPNSFTVFPFIADVESRLLIDQQIPAVMRRLVRWLIRICFFGTCFYFPCRLYLIIEAWISLRALPAGAFIDIQWTSFIPHF